MDIALIGYGKMGKAIEKIAIERGHNIVCIIDSHDAEKFDSEEFKKADVAIEFSMPAVAVDNYKKAFSKGVAVVSGTTGWLDKLHDVKKMCEDNNATFFYSSNFSIGVNIFFAVNEYLAKIMNRFSQYDVSIKEIHHVHKLDHPSGTAISIAEGIERNIDRKSGWTEGDAGSSLIHIESERIGEVPGTHIVEYASGVDAIRIEHEAFSREGFALGAVVAAEWLKGKKGWFTMNDMLKFND